MHEKSSKRILIGDPTLRDGEQAPGFSMNPAEKLRMAHQLARLGSDMIDAGFPSASDDELLAVRSIADEVRGPQIGGLARAKAEDIECLARALEGSDNPVVLTFVSTSDIHLDCKLGWSRAQALERAVASVELGRRLVGNVSFAAEDATRSDRDFLAEVFSAVIEAGAQTVVVADTVGYILPHEMAELVRALRREVKGIDDVVLAVHCHDDLGLAVANSLAAVRAGADQVDCTVNGIGERAGNASLEEVCMILKTRGIGYHTGVNSEEIVPTSKLLAEITGHAPSPNKAIVGGNAFAHEAGIHQAGVIRNALTYEIMTPESVGIERPNLVIGKHSGKRGLKFRLEELGYALSDELIAALYPDVVKLAEQNKQVSDAHLVRLVSRLTAARSSDSLTPAPLT